MAGELLITGLFLALEAGAYLWAANHLRHREVSKENTRAWGGFLLWWVGTAISSFATFVRHALMEAGIDGGAVQGTLLLTALLTSFIGTAGLLTYLFTLLQGPRDWHLAWYGVAALLFAQTAALILDAQPVAALDRGATLGMEYVTPLSPLIGIAAIPNVLLPLGLLAVLAVRTRGMGSIGGRTRRLSALLAAWIITKAVLTGGALGLAPSIVGWGMRIIAIVVALLLARTAVTPSELHSGEGADGPAATRADPRS